tara:strand:+ start:4451 stop:4714 length:264 start_codon:yes stop_codon:yes gene_type:complete
MGEILDKWNQVKNWYESKTIIGIIVAALGAVLAFIFPEVDVNESIEVVKGSGDVLAGGIDSLYIGAIELFGLALAAWGRFKATTGIK